MENKGLKYDNGKAPLDLIPTEAIEEIAKVLGFGARKYDRHNWRGGIVYSRLIAAALRHITAFNNGHDTDEESGLSHIAHALCCLAFLQTFISKGQKSLDDRYKGASCQTTKKSELKVLSSETMEKTPSEQPKKMENKSMCSLNDQLVSMGLPQSLLTGALSTNFCPCGKPYCTGSEAV